MGIKAQQRPTICADEVRNGAVDFQEVLDVGELLTGSPTVTVSPAGPTIGSIGVNTAALIINNRSVAIGQAVTFSFSDGTAGTRYTLTVECGTDASPAQTLRAKLDLDVIA